MKKKIKNKIKLGKKKFPFSSSPFEGKGLDPQRKYIPPCVEQSGFVSAGTKTNGYRLHPKEL